MNVGIIGAGYIGRKRAESIVRCEDTNLVVIADIDELKAGTLASEMGCSATTKWHEVVSRHDVDIIVVSTWPKFHSSIVVDAVGSGKHVLCEKPFGRNPEEAKNMVTAAQVHSVKLKAGFNLRHKAAISKARQLFDQGSIGDLIFVRCNYGHGGRPGYDTEWRADPEIAGGGQLMDLGIHIVDLVRWFMGEPSLISAAMGTLFWYAQSLEDNAFVLFQYGNGQIASLHSSSTQWKNSFVFELFGSEGYIVVNGLGGSYGIERIIRGRKYQDSVVPQEVVYNFEGIDVCWDQEWREFINAIREDREPLGNGHDGWRAQTFVHAAYDANRDRKAISVDLTR